MAVTSMRAHILVGRTYRHWKSRGLVSDVGIAQAGKHGVEWPEPGELRSPLTIILEKSPFRSLTSSDRHGLISITIHQAVHHLPSSSMSLPDL
jgi:hypothetical protein